ncbi:TonB-dependent receptor [uncultured Alistipes sp.]|uniref:SusC/RagA family TonB-linked outer membrane protein n=1 Tax=uncultured Alistipes sp. TaxID=538949 RepID=UPI00262250C3|nr:TonB-dependent receptor [uncultured Alistipes sp.]
MIRKLVLSLVAVLSVAAMAVAQNKQVSGRVSGEDGNPIVGATVLVEGSTTSGTSTNIAGEFALRAPVNGNLVVSFIGYESQVVAINGQTNLEVVLKEDTKSIDDVIVVAFGQAKKEAFTGSAGIVKSDDIAKVQTSNVAQALAGQVSGVQLSNSTGAPGSSPSIRIRGFSSISASQEPLFIVDGAPYEGDLNNINPNDIESMTVLKDAASNALYGARGANGVIMITTKRAKGRDAIVTVDAKWGVNSRATKDYDYITDPGQYYETHYHALYSKFLSDGQTAANAMILANNQLVSSEEGGLGYNVFTVPNGQYMIGSNGRMNPAATLGRRVTYKGQDYWLTADDWNDEAYENSFRQEYNVSVSGSTDRSNFYASFGYLNSKGIVQGSDMYRYTARLKADFQAKKWLKVGANASYANFDWNSLNADGEGESTANVFAFTSSMAPIYPVYVRDGMGNVMYDQYGIKMYDYGNGMNAGLTRPVFANANALLDSQLNPNNSNGNAFSGSAFADFTLYEGLKVTLNVGMNLDETRYSSMLNRFYGQFASQGGILSKQHSRSFSYNLQQLINYSKTFAEHHSIDIMAGHEYYNYSTALLNGSRSNIFLDGNDELANALVDGSVTSYSGEYNNEGYFGRVQYDYDERIFVSGSYRRDASSRFHPDHRWGNFWSAGAAWLINRESWFNVKWIDMLKLKASIGSQGNDNIGAYRYTHNYQIVNSASKPGVIFTAQGNENITWETNTNFNVGAEFDLFKGRLSGSFEYFYRKTTDMLFAFPVAPSMGYSSYYANIGDMRNSGIELNLNAVLLNRKNVQWNFGLNLTHYKNKILKLPEERKTAKTIEGYEGFASGSYFFTEGESLHTFYIPKYAGVKPDTGESMWYTTNPETGAIETTTAYQQATYYTSGNAIADLYGGFNTSIAFFGVDVSASFTYQIGGLAYDSGYAGSMTSPVGTSVGMNMHKDLLNAWTPENPESNIPRLQYNDRYTAAVSDRFLTDASYLNIQNIQVGYTFPHKWTSKFGVHSLRVYLACDNVFYWSYRDGFDPRYSFTGSTNNATYSPIRTISGGITVQF